MSTDAFKVAGSSDTIEGDDMKKDVAALRADVEKLFSDVAKYARQEVEAGVDTGAEAKEAMEKKVRDLSDEARVYVRDNPIGACAAAAAAGFAAALLLRR